MCIKLGRDLDNKAWKGNDLVCSFFFRPFFCVNSIALCNAFFSCLLCLNAGLFDTKGRLLGTHSSPIQIWKEGDCVEVVKSIMCNLTFSFDYLNAMTPS